MLKRIARWLGKACCAVGWHGRSYDYIPWLSRAHDGDYCYDYDRKEWHRVSPFCTRCGKRV